MFSNRELCFNFPYMYVKRITLWYRSAFIMQNILQILVSVRRCTGNSGHFTAQTVNNFCKYNLLPSRWNIMYFTPCQSPCLRSPHGRETSKKLHLQKEQSSSYMVAPIRNQPISPSCPRCDSNPGSSVYEASARSVELLELIYVNHIKVTAFYLSVLLIVTCTAW